MESLKAISLFLNSRLSVMRLSMSTWDEIEVATIAMKRRSYNDYHVVFRLSLKKSSRAIKTKKSAKKCASCSGLQDSSLLLASCKTILNILRRFLWKNRRFDGKRATKTTSAGTLDTERLSYAKATKTKSKVCTENFPEFFHTLESLYHAFKTHGKVFLKSV